MPVSSIVRNTLGIKSHVVKSVEQNESGIEIKLDIRKRRRLPCGTCVELGRVRDRLSIRRWKHVPLWGIPVTFKYAPARVRCAKCGMIRVEEIPWSQGKFRLSVGLIWSLAAWCKLLSWNEVAVTGATLCTCCWLGFARLGLPVQESRTGHLIRSAKLSLAHH